MLEVLLLVPEDLLVLVEQLGHLAHERHAVQREAVALGGLDDELPVDVLYWLLELLNQSQPVDDLEGEPDDLVHLELVARVLRLFKIQSVLHDEDALRAVGDDLRVEAGEGAVVDELECILCQFGHGSPIDSYFQIIFIHVNAFS